jgi:hypothetical protein
MMGKDDEKKVEEVDTNAGEDAKQGTVAEADVKEGDEPKAPERG